jgi:hypothetical protein
MATPKLEDDFPGMYARETDDFVESPCIDSICVEYDGSQDFTIGCFLHGLGYVHTFDVSAIRWTSKGSDWESNVLGFPQHKAECQLFVKGGKCLIEMENERSRGPVVQTDGTITMEGLPVTFRQSLKGPVTQSICLGTVDTGVYKHPAMADPYKIVCNGFVVGENYITDKTLNPSGTVEIEVGRSDKYQIQIGSSSADTYLWLGDSASTIPPGNFWTMDKSFRDLGGSSGSLALSTLPGKFQGRYKSTKTMNSGEPDFYVTFKENSYSVIANNPDIAWGKKGTEFPYEYLVNIDDTLVMGHGENGTDFLFTPSSNSVSLYDQTGPHTSTVVPDTAGPSKSTSAKSDDGVGPILVVALLLGILWAMK